MPTCFHTPLKFFTITGLIAAILHFYHWFVKFFSPAAVYLSHVPFISIPFILIPHAPFPTAQPPGPGGQDKPSTRLPPIANNSSKSHQMG